MSSDALHGRELELEELAGHVKAVAAEEGRAVTLLGPAGIGKTALLQAAVEESRAVGLRVLRARGAEADQAVPYGVIRQLLAPATIGEQFGTEGAAQRGRALIAGGTIEGPDDELSVGLAVFWLVADIASAGPLLLAVDDLHWIDPASQRVLDLLRVRLVDLPVLLLSATRRLPETGWADDTTMCVIDVRPLAPDAVARLVAAVLGDASPELASACHEVTGGNAFFLREVLHEARRIHHGATIEPALVRTLLPDSIVRNTTARLAALGADAVRLARAIALLGDGVDIGRAAFLATIDPDDAAVAADALAASGILLAERPLRFVHPLLLTAVRDAIPPRDRSGLHTKAAELVRSDPGGLDAACAHLLHVDPAGSADVVKLLRRGAEGAAARGAADASVLYLRRALAEPPPREDLAQVTVDLAGAAYTAQEPDAMELAYAAVEHAIDPQQALLAAMNAGHLIALGGSPKAALELVLTAMDAPGVPEFMTQIATGMAITWSACAIEARDAARPLLREVRERGISPEAPNMVRAVAALEAAIGHGTAAEASATARQAWDDGALLRETGTDQPFVHFACIGAGLAGEIALVELWGEQCVEEAASRGSALGRFASTIWCAFVGEARGDLAAAEAYAREAVELAARSGGMQLVLPFPVAILADTLLQRRGPAEALEALDLLPLPSRDPQLVMTPVWWLARAAAELHGGRPGAALAALEAVETWERRWPAETGGWALWRPLAAEAHLALGDDGSALQVALEGVEHAERFGAPRPVGRALRALALASPLAERAELLTRAIEITADESCGIDQARCLVDRGEARLATGQQDSAVEDLLLALAKADEAGAGAVAARAMKSLVHDGARPRRRARSGALALTPAERRIVDLAARDRSNRQIAEMLFLTEKTVETHLSNSYRKLGIRSRTQLAQALAAFSDLT